ncbi:MAG: DUF2460 domain-containing protein [Acidobacteriia bacterium]|nr:DUF2460 domain-containing protein [Terriglobia bacterium]
MAHYPFAKRRRNRSIVNQALDGSSTKLYDANGGEIEWDLSYRGLSQNEMEGLRTFFTDVEGRLESFTFADPSDNLLAWSEGLNQPVWVRDGLLQATEGIVDPMGTTRATRLSNGAQTEQSIRQAVAVTGAHYYCLSLHLRSITPATVSLTAFTDQAGQTAVVSARSQWRRVESTFTLNSNLAPVRFQIELPAAAMVDVFGLQVEAQITASPYKKTTLQGGVYPESRFNQDELIVGAQGPDDYETRLQVICGIKG